MQSYANLTRLSLFGAGHLASMDQPVSELRLGEHMSPAIRLLVNVLFVSLGQYSRDDFQFHREAFVEFRVVDAVPLFIEP